MATPLGIPGLERRLSRGAFDWLRPLMAGRVVACIASGPSLTAGDCELIRAAGLPAIVTNSSFRLAPWADVLLAYDGRWWKAHERELAAAARIPVHRVTVSPAGRLPAAPQSLAKLLAYKPFGNSGTAAISLAAFAGARRIILIGYDCGRGPGGEAHWHADHPEGLTNAASLKTWPGKFAAVALYARRHGAAVVNASASTTLQCFDRASLPAALGRG